jgi:mannose-6-phosphate isomerase-like protein (cupin superfamily)
MSHASSIPRLRTHANYDRLVALAAESHARGRDPFAATPRDIALARLYSHAFRRHVIGAFHATRRELAAVVDAGPATAEIARATESLADLADRSMDPVEHDIRALISSFHHYAVHVGRVVESLGRACDLASGAWRGSLAVIRERFVAHMEAITAGNGLSLTRDTAAPAQGCFQVPNLGITIVPLVYGDHHSWNLAWLDGAKSDVPCHLHREGVEIHLGYGPLHGDTILGDVKAEVTEGYAMPIPPGTRHGYVNIGSRMHHVPFIFGSLTLGGWGVFLDVDSRPTEAADLAVVPVTAAELNGTVFLEREIAAAAAAQATCRRTLIPAARTDRDGTGGIELSVAALVTEPLVLVADRFRAVSVIRGSGTLALAGEQVALAPHDHFGIPAGLPATLTADGGEPLVLLDATLEEGVLRNNESSAESVGKNGF